MQSAESSNIILPEGTSCYSHQIGGHIFGENSKIGVLKHKSGSIIKPIKEDDSKTKREFFFYKNVFSNENSDPILAELTRFLPKFSGTCQIKIKNKEVNCLCLEDICETFTKPSLLDIKMGCKTYDPEADDAKREYEDSKCVNSVILGFRIIGMKIYCSNTNSYRFKDKKFGKQVIAEDMEKVLEQMLTTDAQINYIILCGYLHKLTALLDWFKIQRKFAFYSSSLLFVYEGSLPLWNKWTATIFNCNSTDDSNETSRMKTYIKNIICPKIPSDKQCQICFSQKEFCSNIISHCDFHRVSIIDCAHVFPASEEDTNYTFGLKNLINLFQLMLKNQKTLVCDN